MINVFMLRKITPWTSSALKTIITTSIGCDNAFQDFIENPLYRGQHFLSWLEDVTSNTMFPFITANKFIPMDKWRYF